MGKKSSLWLKKVWKELWPWRFSAFRWKRLDLQTTIMDTVVFKILSVAEAVVLVSTLCFFYVCCGCKF
ncbi:putative transmembrane protein [Sesbania bispinosa]|nr:putative transmembrane protein [Sesbania bispinosa]